MKISLLVALVFISQSLLAGDPARCHFSFHGIDKSGRINKQPYLTHKHVIVVAKTTDRTTKKEMIVVKFNDEGAAINKKYTTANVGRYVAIYCDGNLLSKPRIMGIVEDELAFNVE